MKAFVQTYSGVPFYPLAPSLGAIQIDDIAHALSMLCRYGGHTRRFYSVAEHSVILSHAVAPENARWALMHDATEAYIGDMVWPLKEEIPQFKEVEEVLMSAICTRFGLPQIQPPQVVEYDRRIVIDERDMLLAPSQLAWPALEGYKPLGVSINAWSPDRAKAEFLNRFRQLFNPAH